MEVEVEILPLIRMKPFLAFHETILHRNPMEQTLTLPVREIKRLDSQIFNQVKQASKVMIPIAEAVLAKVIIYHPLEEVV